MKKYFIFLIFALFSSILMAQNDYTTKKTLAGKAKEYYEEAKNYRKKSDWNNAIKSYEKCLKEDPKFIDGYIAMGLVEYSQNYFDKAELAYTNAMKISKTYEPQLYFTIAELQVLQNKFDAAILNYEAYIATKPQNEELLKVAHLNLGNTRFKAATFKNTNLSAVFKATLLPSNINTKMPEYLPTFTLDENELIFTRRVNGFEDFFESRRVDGQWQVATPIAAINTRENEGSATISANGKLIIFSACNRPDGLGDCDLYSSEYTNGAWTKPSNMGATMNSKAWDSQPSLAPDGQTLYFASSRPESIGGTDIWRSTRNLRDNTKWDIPTRLDTVINTIYNEQSPFMHFDNKSLYFMSNGHPGMGGHDLYVTYKKEDNTFVKPQNLGYPINTVKDEANLIVAPDGKTAYFASDRFYDINTKSLTIDCIAGAQTDIYTFELPENVRAKAVTYVKAYVEDAVTHKALLAKVEILNAETDKVQTAVYTDTEGEFMTALPYGKSYTLYINKEKYTFYSDRFVLADSNTSVKPFILKIALQPISETTTATTNNPNTEHKAIILKNVFFTTGSAELKKESESELNRLRDMLTANPTVQIQINGHTDNVGNDASNQLLSENRAKSVYDYLIKQKIDAKRLKYKGFGKSQPIDTNATESGRQQNRRTEFEVW